MKELSIEDKAKRYDKAIIEFKPIYDLAKEQGRTIDVKEFERIFPELKESEDEYIRKKLIAYFKNLSDVYSLEPLEINPKKVIVWLEKQKVLTTEEDLQGKEDVLWCIKQAKKYAKDENEMGTCWFAEKWLEKQGETFTKKDVDDAYLEGVTNTKNEIEKEYEATYQIRKDIATFILNYKGDIKDRAKWMNYLGIKVSFVEKQGEQKATLCDKCKKSQPSHSRQDITALGRCALEKQGEQKSADKSEPTDYNSIDPYFGKPIDKVEPKFHLD